MKKRDFLTTGAAAAAALPATLFAQQVPPSTKGPTLLTVSGLVSKQNRGALDPSLDQMMVKQKIKFDKAYSFDFAALLALPAKTIRPTLEYDNKQHTLQGPWLADVLRTAGAPLRDMRVLVRAIDGYNISLNLEQMRKYNFIVATHLDGNPMPLGGLGPLWTVFDADRYPDIASKPLFTRFTLCPWATYHLEVQLA